MDQTIKPPYRREDATGATLFIAQRRCRVSPHQPRSFASTGAEGLQAGRGAAARDNRRGSNQTPLQPRKSRRIL